MRIRNDTYADEQVEQLAQLDKTRFRAAEEERRRQFALDSRRKTSSKTDALKRDFERKTLEAGSASPSFSVNLSKPGTEEIAGGFSVASPTGRRGSLIVPLTRNLIGVLGVVKVGAEIFQAFTAEDRFGYMPSLKSFIHDRLYPGESVRVALNPGEPSGHVVVIEAVNAPSLTRPARENAPTQWELGSLPYTQPAPRSFTVERDIQSGPMRPLHEYPSEHSAEQYRYMSDAASKQYKDKIM